MKLLVYGALGLGAVLLGIIVWLDHALDITLEKVDGNIVDLGGED